MVQLWRWMGGGESGGSGGRAASAVGPGFSPVRESVTHLCKSSRLSQSILSLSLPLAMHTPLAALKFHPLLMHIHTHIPPPYTCTHSFSPANGGQYCLGRRQRYRTCNTQVCPTPGDLRQQQCERNPLSNKYNEWEVPSFGECK